MIVLNIIRWIKGYVNFSGKGKYPERFINSAAKENLQMWNVKGAERSVTGTMAVESYKRIIDVSRSSGVITRIESRHGLPFIIHRNKNRGGLLIGAVCFLIIIKILSLFVWNVEVRGNSALSESFVKQVLSETGISIGTFRPSIDIDRAERSAMIKLSNVSWLSLNIIGTTVYADITESSIMPDVIDNETPCNIKAACDSKIIRIDIGRGTAEVVNGDYVTQGQLLISGVVEDTLGNSTLQHAKATIYAETKQKIKVDVPVNFTQVLPDNEVKIRKKLDFMGLKLPINFTAVNSEDGFMQTKKEQLTVFGGKLPIWLDTERWYYCSKNSRTIDDYTIESIANKKILFTELFALNDKKILSKNITVEKSGDVYTYNADYICEEDIAVEEPIGISG